MRPWSAWRRSCGSRPRSVLGGEKPTRRTGLVGPQFRADADEADASVERNRSLRPGHFAQRCAAFSSPFVTAGVTASLNSAKNILARNAALAGTFSAPRETRTPTRGTPDKALNLVATAARATTSIGPGRCLAGGSTKANASQPRSTSANYVYRFAQNGGVPLGVTGCSIRSMQHAPGRSRRASWLLSRTKQSSRRHATRGEMPAAPLISGRLHRPGARPAPDEHRWSVPELTARSPSAPGGIR